MHDIQTCQLTDSQLLNTNKGRRGRDRMVVSTNWFPVTKYKQGPSWSWSYGSWIYTYLMLWVRIRSGEVYSIQHYVIKFVSDLRQVGGFLRVHRFPLTINLTATV